MSSRARCSGDWPLPGGPGSLVKVEDGMQVPSLVGVRAANVGINTVVTGVDFRAEEGFNRKTFDVFMSEARADAGGKGCSYQGWQRKPVEREINARLVVCPGVGTGEKAQASNSRMYGNVGEDHNCGAQNGSGENF